MLQSTGNGRAPMTSELIVAHTSDLHLGGHWHKGGDFDSLRAVLDAACETRAHVLILAGDVFDSHRAAANIVEGAAGMMAAAAYEIVILPGNHDPATPDAVYRHESMSRLPNVHVLGITTGGSVRFAALGLEIAGIPHVAYADFTPLAAVAERTMPWHIVVAHGHWVTSEQDAHRGWLIHDREIAASGADYVALGHWDLPQPVGDGSVPAYYSGSPELARTVNIVTFTTGNAPEVRRHPLHFGA